MTASSLHNSFQGTDLFTNADYDLAILNRVLPYTMPSPEDFSNILSKNKEYMATFGRLVYEINKGRESKKRKAWRISSVKDKFLDHYIEEFIADRHRVITLKNIYVKNSVSKIENEPPLNKDLHKKMIVEITKYFDYETKSRCHIKNIINAWNNKIYVFKFNNQLARGYFMATGRDPYQIKMSR